MKYLFKILKRVVTGGLSLFTFNMMIAPFNIVIPINLFTIGFTAIFGILSLPFFSILIMYFV